MSFIKIISIMFVFFMLTVVGLLTWCCYVLGNLVDVCRVRVNTLDTLKYTKCYCSVNLENVDSTLATHDHVCVFHVGSCTDVVLLCFRVD